MSVIIKSNKSSKSSLGLIGMIDSTPEQELAKYKARVIADGGVIRDEARTLLAFEEMFSTKHYGWYNTNVSGSYGVKITNGNQIEKLYAIDGLDMIAEVSGSGSLPTITTDSAIDFTANKGSGSVNGCILRTADTVPSLLGNMSLAVKPKFSDSYKPFSPNAVACAAVFYNVVDGQVYSTGLQVFETEIYANGTNGMKSYLLKDDLSAYRDASATKYAGTSNLYFSFVVRRDIGRQVVYRGPDAVVNSDASSVFNFSDIVGFISLGGVAYSGGTYSFYDGVIYDFNSLKHTQGPHVVSAVGNVPL